MVLSQTDRRVSSGLVIFAIKGVEPEQAVAHLWERNRIAARRVSLPSCMRASLHFLNTEDEVGALAETGGAA